MNSHLPGHLWRVENHPWASEHGLLITSFQDYREGETFLELAAICRLICKAGIGKVGDDSHGSRWQEARLPP